MNAFTNYLEKLGNNFLVSAMVPSFALVVISILMFDPILPVATAFKDPQSNLQLVGFGLIVFILTVIIGFTLTVLNTHILKIFEGYIIFPPLRFLYNKSLRIYRRKARDLMAQRESLKKEYISLKKNASDASEMHDKLEKIINEHYKVASEYDQDYPANLDDILPTKFGNTLRAAEDHAVQRYGFDGVTFWPRLIHVIPDSYKATIDSARNELSFLANMSILSAAFSFLCFLAVFYVMATTNVVSGDAIVFGAFARNVLKYFIASALGMIGFRLFYSASIISLGSFTLAIRSSFDLFRLDLLKKLEMARPNDFDEEFDTWVNLNELIVLGNQSLTFQKFVHRKEENTK
jgi:hypothetical protein